MVRLIDDDERRARLGRRHLLSPGHQAANAEEVTRALTAVHGTDPGSTVLGILARSPISSIADIETALYDTRSIVRVLAMRRTVFAVNYELAPSIWTSFDVTVARNQHRLFVRALEGTGINDAGAWIAEAEKRLLAFLDAHPGSTSKDIAGDDPYLSHRLPLIGPGATASSQSVASRLLTLMSAEGKVIRARPKGGWTSSQFTWAATNHWRSDWPERPSSDDADTEIARSWLFGYGPAAVEDLAWWTGWPKGRSRKAIDRAAGVEVRTNEGPAFVLSSDVEPVETPAPWVALLPGLDSSTMGWKLRDFYLGPHATRLFDNVGNAGPTVWADGRIVGGWTQRENGEIAFEIYEDVGRSMLSAIDEYAGHLQHLLAGVRLKPRARRYTASELALR
jgi:hypothetical protein